MEQQIDLLSFQNQNKKWLLNGEGVYLPAFKASLQDFLIHYADLITDTKLREEVNKLNQSENDIILPIIETTIPKIVITQNQILDLLKNDYKAIKPWLFYSWSDIPDEYLATAIQAHYNNEVDLSLFWNVGDARVYTDGGTKKVCFTILDFNKDTLTTPVNGHTKSAISLAVTTNNKLQPGAAYSYTSDYTYGFTYNSGHDLTSFINFLTNNDIDTTYFLTAENYQSVSKDLIYYSSYGDGASKESVLNQEIHIPDFFDILNQNVISKTIGIIASI